MNDRKMTRRQALKAGTVGVVAIGVSGCGAVAHAGRVVVSVAWPTIQRVVTAIVRRSGNLIVTAIVAAVERTLKATLTSEQASSLGSGGHLFLRPEDGVEHQIPYTIE
jgi:predicted dinucleotide-binding enzyme